MSLLVSVVRLQPLPPAGEAPSPTVATNGFHATSASMGFGSTGGSTLTALTEGNGDYELAPSHAKAAAPPPPVDFFSLEIENSSASSKGKIIFCFLLFFSISW